MNVITFIYHIIFRIAAALQYEEFEGYCLKPDGNYAYDGENMTADVMDLLDRVDSTKESCLSQCLLVEGAKACEYESGYICLAIMIEVSGGEKDEDSEAICWKFLDKGESLYAQ